MQSMPTRHAKRYKLRKAELFVWVCQLTEDNASEVSNWANGAQIVEETDPISGKTYEGLNVRTGPDGSPKHRASLGDFIVKFGDGDNARYVVLKPGSFAQRYVEAPL